MPKRSLSWVGNILVYHLSWLLGFLERLTMVTSVINYVRRQGYELTAMLETISGPYPNHGELIWSMLLLLLSMSPQSSKKIHLKLEGWNSIVSFIAYFQGFREGILWISFEQPTTFNFPQVQNTWKRGTMSWRRSFLFKIFLLWTFWPRLGTILRIQTRTVRWVISWYS